MGWESPSHWLIIAILVIALFGYKKLPDATRSLGRSLRILKTEVKSLHDDEPEVAEQAPVAPRAVEAPRAAVPEAGSPTVPAGTPVTPTTRASDADHR